MRSNQTIVISIISGLFGCWVKYMAYFFLTATVLLTFSGLIFTYVTVFGPTMPILRYFSFLIPIDAFGNSYLEESDIMRVYSFLAFGLMILSLIGRGILWLIKHLNRQMLPSMIEDEKNEQEISFWRNFVNLIGGRRLVINIILITLIFLISFIVMPKAQLTEGTNIVAMYVVFAVFYVIAILSDVVYIVIDSISDRILWWAASQIR